MKDLGPLEYFLGIEVDYGYRVFFVPIECIMDLISSTALLDDATSDPLMHLYLKLTESLANLAKYYKLVGTLVCLTISCPNISYAFYIISQFVQAPTYVHYAAFFQIIHSASHHYSSPSLYGFLRTGLF